MMMLLSSVLLHVLQESYLFFEVILLSYVNKILPNRSHLHQCFERRGSLLTS